MADEGEGTKPSKEAKSQGKSKSSGGLGTKGKRDRKEELRAAASKGGQMKKFYAKTIPIKSSHDAKVFLVRCMTDMKTWDRARRHGMKEGTLENPQPGMRPETARVMGILVEKYNNIEKLESEERWRRYKDDQSAELARLRDMVGRLEAILEVRIQEAAQQPQITGPGEGNA